MPRTATKTAAGRGKPKSYWMDDETTRLISERAKAWRRSESSYVRELARAEAGLPSALSLPTYTPTAAEKRAIEKGRQSPSMTLDDFFSHVERLAAQSRGKNRRASTPRRTRATARRS